MPIPDLDEQGFLPRGIHECTVEEISARFAQFEESDRRIRLFAKLQSFIAEARKTGLVVELIIDGSYVTAKPKPDDVDLVVVLAISHDFSANLRPFEYNIVSKRRVRETYRFDILVALEGSRACAEYIEFFGTVLTLRCKFGHAAKLIKVQHFCRVHGTLAEQAREETGHVRKVTPAMAAGLADDVWSVERLLEEASRV